MYAKWIYGCFNIFPFLIAFSEIFSYDNEKTTSKGGVFLKTGMRHSDYIKVLLERRNNETRQIDPIHERGDSITSPPGATSLEENRIIMEYMEQKNLQKVISSIPEAKKPILLKKFFKMKRNQEVIIYMSNDDAQVVTGKVTTVGRDFVLLTNLKDRIWIPYSSIESANIPSGVPNYENSHQNFIYDNDLKRKLITNFGETVAKRDVLIRQFFEESFMTNVKNSEGMWVKAVMPDKNVFGRIRSVTEEGFILDNGFNQVNIDWDSILLLYSMRFFHRLYMVSKNMLKTLANL